MERLEAIKLINSLLHGSEIVVCANGMICREQFISRDLSRNFYMLGSMGLASSIGMGVALAKPDRKVIVLDGDGNLLMNLGSLAMIGDAEPKNFLHILLDNGCYESTGGQRTVASAVNFRAIAQNCGYKTSVRAKTEKELKGAVERLLDADGPAFLWVPVTGKHMKDIPRVDKSPVEITRLVRDFLRE
jgi:thiamine pyrophosphate-dependent acetolactate synthase large subunit-like protein